MRANAGGLCIGDQDRLREWVPLSARERQLGWFARARKGEAGADPGPGLVLKDRPDPGIARIADMTAIMAGLEPQANVPQGL